VRLTVLLDERKLALLIRQHGIGKAKDEAPAKVLATFLRKADEGNYGGSSGAFRAYCDLLLNHLQINSLERAFVQGLISSGTHDGLSVSMLPRVTLPQPPTR